LPLQNQLSHLLPLLLHNAAIPFMRNIVFRIARVLGKATKAWRSFPFVFIVGTFLLIPIILVGLSSCFEKDTKGFTALGVFLIFLFASGMVYIVVWWRYRDGKQRFKVIIHTRRRRAAAYKTLADELDYLKVDTEWCKNEIGRIKDYAGLPHDFRAHLPGTTAEQEYEQGSVTEALEQGGEEEEIIDIAEEFDDRVSLYESCRSKPWRDILLTAAGSVRSGIHGATTNSQIG
jgi:hypothetical protein